MMSIDSKPCFRTGGSYKLFSVRTCKGDMMKEKVFLDI